MSRAPHSADNGADYHDKAGPYFDNRRLDIAPLLPAQAGVVLEVGCGAGATLQWLRQSGRATRTVGVELFPDAAERARERVDELLQGNAEILLPAHLAPASFDLVLCLDVLEHMVDPWAFVTRVQALMKPGAVLIASIPNVRHLRVVLPLLLAGRWRYEDSGVLDRTHLRFFTHSSAMALVEPPGLRVTACLRRLPPVGSMSGVVNLLTLGLARDLFTRGFLIAARKD
jgi:SAM-dependent methyltransferase